MAKRALLRNTGRSEPIIILLRLILAGLAVQYGMILGCKRQSINQSADAAIQRSSVGDLFYISNRSIYYFNHRNGETLNYVRSIWFSEANTLVAGEAADGITGKRFYFVASTDRVDKFDSEEKMQDEISKFGINKFSFVKPTNYKN